MKKVTSNSREVKLIQKEDLTPVTVVEQELQTLDMRIELIQALIPLGLEAVEEELQKEVIRLTGEKTVAKGKKPPIVDGVANPDRCICPIKKFPSWCRGCAMWKPMRKCL